MTTLPKIVFYQNVCIVFVLCLSGCKNESTEHNPEERPEKNTPQHVQQLQKIESYISKWTPFLNKDGSSIRLEPLEQNGSWKIRVGGTEIIPPGEKIDEYRFFFEGCLRLMTEPPAELQFDVKYQTADRSDKWEQ